MLAIANGGTGATEVNERLPRWRVKLNASPSVRQFGGYTHGWPDYMELKGVYVVSARDELEAFMVARKMEEEGKGVEGHIQV